MTEKIALAEMVALADADLSDAISMGLARRTWQRPNTAAEDRTIEVRRAVLTTLQLFATHESAVRAALKSSGRSMT